MNRYPGSPLVPTKEKSTRNQSLGYELTHPLKGEKSTRTLVLFGTVSSTKYYSVFTNLCIIYYFIWRNNVLFTNLHSSHLGIIMMDSTQQNILREKNYFKLSSHWQFGNISSSFGFVLYSIQNWNVLVCLQNDVKLVVPFSFENSKRSFITKL